MKSEVYRVTIECIGKPSDRVITHTETTLAACKALVHGLTCPWSISQWRTNSVTKEEALCGIACYQGNPDSFKMGTDYTRTASRWMLETFKKSGMRKDLNNTTYISCDQYRSNMWEKKWGKMQETANNKFPQFA